MSKWVYLNPDNTIREIIPDNATKSLPEWEDVTEGLQAITKWYGEDFAAHCVEAPDEVMQNWSYDGLIFIPPVPPEITPPQPTAEDRLRADVDYMAILLGVTL